MLAVIIWVQAKNSKFSGKGWNLQSVTVRALKKSYLINKKTKTVKNILIKL